MIVVNDVSVEIGIMGGECNFVCIISCEGVDVWFDMLKGEVVEKLVEKIVFYFVIS